MGGWVCGEEGKWLLVGGWLGELMVGEKESGCWKFVRKEKEKEWLVGVEWW